MKLIKEVKDLPKAKDIIGTDELIPMFVKRRTTSNGFEISLPIGTSVKVKPSTLQNAEVTTDKGKLQMVIINCYDENGKLLYWIPYECVTNDTYPNKFLMENQRK